MSTPATLFLVFNRPETTARVFEAIRQARPARLYVAADGPRADRLAEAERCAEVRHIATQVDWPCELHTLFRDSNLGCREAVSSAITWFFEHEPEGIILEDDCLPHPSFFPFCQDLLARYRDDPRIMCITGNNFQDDMNGWPHSYYYSIYNHCWGWASWRRAWAEYDAELARFEPAGARRILRGLSRVPGFVQAWMNNFESVHRGAVDSWAYVWTWSCWTQGGLTCTPRVNLVSNIGFGADATHTTGEGAGMANLPVAPLPPPYTAPPHLAAKQPFDDYVSCNVFGVTDHTQYRIAIRRLRNLAGRTLRSVGLR